MRQRKYTVFDKRVREKFLFLPKTLRTHEGQLETRWLEKAVWVEQLRPSHNLFLYLFNFSDENPSYWRGGLYWNE